MLIRAISTEMAGLEEIEFVTGQGEEYDEVLLLDDKEGFVSLIDDRMSVGYFYRPALKEASQEFMSAVCKYPSINCATALINGETPLSVDLNYPDNLGIYPIHHAAWSCWPNITKLFLQHGARPDLPCRAVHHLLKQKLPYQLALERFARMGGLNDWVPENCPFDLVLELCQPRRQEAFQTIGLLGFGEKETKEQLLHFVKDGKIVEFAIMLIVGNKMFNDRKLRIRNLCSSIKDNELVDDERRVLMSSVLQLLDVSERAGDAISAYVMKEKVDRATLRRTNKDVTNLLEQAGFAFNIDISDHDWSVEDDRFYAEEGMLTHVVNSHFSKPNIRPYRERVLAKNLLASKLKMEAEAKSKITPAWHNLSNVSSRNPWASITSVMKGALKKCI